MNMDHFFFLDSEDLLQPPNSAAIQKRFKLHKSLKKDFKDLPKTSKIDHDEYTIVNAAPSVVANPYLPAFRIFSYNITGHNDERTRDDMELEKKKGSKRKHGHRHGGKKKDCKKKENRDNWECRPQKPWHSSAKSPSRMNTLWSPLGYAQFYLPDLKTANKTHPPSWELEYVTYRLSALHPSPNASNAETAAFVHPIPPRLLPLELRNVTGMNTSELAPYDMEDLTIQSWLKLARRLVKDKKLWKKFKKYMYLGA